MTKYRAEIDGLRTIAVIPVIIFHLGYSFAKGGYYGVDVFFVISGYLITKILTHNIVEGNFSMYQFWIRRIKRLLPLLLTVILTTLLLTPLLFKPVVKDISYDIFPALFSYFNFHALYNFGDYWGGDASKSFFLHSWSLSVEEQFYLLYPFFLLFSYKYFKNFFISILTITLLSILLFTYFLFKSNVDIAFYLLPTRIWELSIGGLTGVMPQNKLEVMQKNKWYNTLLSIVGIGLIGFAYLFASKTISFIAILPVIGSALILFVCSPNDIVGKVLSSKPLVFIGKISYSLYLWHWGVILLFENLPQYFNFFSRHPVSGLIVLSTFLLAFLSYTFIENKTRNYKHTPKLVLAGIAVIAGITLYFNSDLFEPYYESKYNKQIAYFSYYSISPKDSVIKDANSPFYYNVSRPLRPQKFTKAYKEDGIIPNPEYGTPKIMLIGDSHGAMWAKLLDEISNELETTISFYTSNGDKPFVNLKDINSQEKKRYFTVEQRIEYAKSLIGNIDKWKPKIIIIACRWETLGNKSKDQLFELLSYIEERDINVLIFTQPPALNFVGDNKNIAQYFTYIGIEPVNGYNLLQLKSTDVKGNDLIKSLPEKYKNLCIYDVHKNMIENNRVRVTHNNDVLYYDDDHLSYHGTLIHRDSILSLIQKTINL